MGYCTFVCARARHVVEILKGEGRGTFMDSQTPHSSTNDHRYVRTRHPVRSAIYKHVIAGLVLRWVTTWESPVLFVLHFCSLGGRVAPWTFPLAIFETGCWTAGSPPDLVPGDFSFGSVGWVLRRRTSRLHGTLSHPSSRPCVSFSFIGQG